MEELDLDWAKLASITTDRTPSMVGPSWGLVGRIKREMEEQGLTPPLQVHCLISPASTVLQSSEVGFCHEGGCVLHKLHQSELTETHAVPSFSVRAGVCPWRRALPRWSQMVEPEQSFEALL